MTDKEMLVLAAKAVGYKWREDVAEYRKEHELIGLWIDGVGSNWNPLEKCDNAFRLANKLSIDVLHNWDSVTAQWELGKFCRVKCTDETRDEATRRAITRAAAEIGKAMT